MPADKRQQSNAMLYTLIAFVGLFIIAVALAVIYYVKFEDQRTIADDSKRKLKEMAAPAEQRKGLGKIIGTIPRGKSGLGTMVDYLDETVYLIIGGLPEDTSAEVKLNTVNRKVKDTLELLAQEYPDIETSDPNTTGLIQIIEKLKTKLDNLASAKLATEAQLKDLQNRFNDAMTIGFEKEQKLLAEKEKYQQQVNDIQKNYDELKDLVEQTSEQQVRTIMTQLDEERANRKKEHQQKLQAQAELEMTKDRLKRIQEKLQAVVPLPDREVAAFKPDGKIILIDNQTKVVHLNIGRNDRVYPGLTFPVYDKNMPIPKDGKSKAEIEVFDVAKTFSAARITRSEIKRPIVVDDIVANLIWDSDKTNVFAVAGEFDLDSDGDTDSEGADKIKALIEEWGGRVADTISIDTDFVVLGSTPQVLRKPTFEELEVYPTKMEKYKALRQKLAHYKEVLKRANDLSIPIFNYERFLYFIGYKTQAARAGAF